MQEHSGEQHFAPFVISEKERTREDADTFDLDQFMRELKQIEGQQVENKVQVKAAKVVDACRNPEAMQRLFKEYPNLKLSVARADVGRRQGMQLDLGSGNSRRKFWQKCERMQFLDRGEGMIIQGILSEYIIKKLFDSANFTTARVRPEIDAACGVDLLGYKEVEEGRVYFAIQVKTMGNAKEVAVDFIDDDYLESFRNKAARSDEEDRTLRGAEACFNNARHMSRAAGHTYYPLMVTVPPLKIVREWVNHETLEPSPETVDNFRKTFIL